ncbi:PXPV repeat protein [Glaciimonas immobilis]|uniref:Uncharacterized protein n=1 Tax=Glaciimonas immobilis TaxID=728004 RepID=A0A840RRM6_9BURK|nr:PXPV repeat protein [Glaciimonas immobilis]KAF3996815.1 hypothetical protein HAV38_16640 [Glaciimonas immobilis]MBB5199638.1 hypothetical protein [Glaciimonas immobilis]
MKKIISIAAGLLASAALLMAASPAMAHVDVGVNIGLPGIFVAPEPVYVQPEPVYIAPRPIYVQPRPVYLQPRPVYIEQQQEPEWRGRQWQENRFREDRRDYHRGHHKGWKDEHDDDD